MKPSREEILHELADVLARLRESRDKQQMSGKNGNGKRDLKIDRLQAAYDYLMSNMK